MPRADSANFILKNKSLSKKPLYTIEIAFDDPPTDFAHFTSNKRAAVPSTATNVYHGYIESISNISQSLNPIRFNSSIGHSSVNLVDVQQAVTSLLNTKLVAGYGTRHKRVRFYAGYQGMVWDDYTLVDTYLIEGKETKNRLYTINSIDVQRQIKDDVFDLYETNLNASITFGDVLIPAPTAAAITNFDTLQHTSIYSDAPSATVGYIRIADEIIRWSSKSSANFVVDNESSTPSVSVSPVGIASGATSIALTDATNFPNGGNQAYGVIIEGATKSTIRWTGKTGNNLTGVTGVDNAFTTSATVYWAKGRGALNTVAINHDVDTTADTDKRPRIDEYVYLEAPVVQAIYGLLTGTLYNSGSPQGIELPANWHLGISTSYVSLAHFTAMQYASIWNPADDTDQTNNIYCFFDGEPKQDGKRFIETQLLPQIGAFMPVLNDGQLGLQLMAGVLSRSPYVRRLTKKDIVSYTSLKHDDTDTHNVFYTPWNWSAIKKKFTRPEVLIDTDSVSVHGTTTPISLPLRGIRGSRHARDYMYSILNFLRDRYAGPPEKISITTLFSHNDLNIGDPIRLELDTVDDFADAGLTLNRTFEIQSKTIDWINGTVTFDLFGSSQKAQPLSEFTTSSAVMNASFWNSAGTDLSTNPGGITTTVTGGVLHIDGNGTLSGNADVTNSAAIYYTTEDDLNLDFGTTVNLTNNVQIRCKGNINIDGIFDGKGGGPAGASSGDGNAGTQAGYGVTQAGGGVAVTLLFANQHEETDNFYKYSSTAASITYAFGNIFTGAQVLNIKNNSTSIAGLKTDIRGVSGGSGKSITGQFSAAGGAGGAGGAGLLLICESVSFGASGSIDLSGNDGTAGATIAVTDSVGVVKVLQAGTGAGGYPGALHILLTSNAGFATDLDTKFIANTGNSGVFSRRFDSVAEDDHSMRPVVGAYQSYWTGYEGEDLSDGGNYAGSSTNPMYRVQLVPDSETAAADVSDITSNPTAINISAAVITKNTFNIVSYDFSVTPPSDGNYLASLIEVSPLGADSWSELGTVKSTQEVVGRFAADGSSYDVRATPISKTGVKSDTYIQKVHTVTSALTVRNAASGKIVFGDDDPATNGGIILSDAGLDMYNTSGTQTVDIDSSDGSFDFGDTSSENYISYNPATPSLTMGKDVKFEGGNAYNNDGFLYHTIFDSLDAFNTTTNGASSSVALSASSGALTLTVDTGAADYAHLNRKFYYTLTSLSWANSRKFKFRIGSFSLDATTCELYVGIGVYTAVNGIFIFYDNGTWKGISLNGGTSSTLTFSDTPIAGDVLEMVFTPAVSAEFYVNGTSQGTITTNLPTGAINTPDLPFYAILRRTTSGDGSTRNVSIGEWKYLEN